MLKKLILILITLLVIGTLYEKTLRIVSSAAYYGVPTNFNFEDFYGMLIYIWIFQLVPLLLPYFGFFLPLKPRWLLFLPIILFVSGFQAMRLLSKVSGAAAGFGLGMFFGVILPSILLFSYIVLIIRLLIKYFPIKKLGAK